MVDLILQLHREVLIIAVVLKLQEHTEHSLLERMAHTPMPLLKTQLIVSQVVLVQLILLFIPSLMVLQPQPQL